MQYGVFSQFTVELDDGDSEESLYWLADTKVESLVQMHRYIMYRAVGLIPLDARRTMDEALQRAVDSEDISKGFNVAGVTYYVREVTQEELVNLNQISLSLM